FFPISVTVGNFNSDVDTDPDLAVANTASGDVSVLLGSTGGTFTGPANLGVGKSTSADLVLDPSGDLVLAGERARRAPGLDHRVDHPGDPTGSVWTYGTDGSYAAAGSNGAATSGWKGDEASSWA